MTNTSIKRGFIPVRYRSGQPYTGAANRYYKDTTANTVISIGDPVIRGTSSSDPEGGPEIVRATTGGAITGVVVSVGYDKTNLSKRYLSATDVGYVWVADDPDLIFEVQEGGASTALAVVNIGKHINSVTALDGDTTLGISKYEIDNGAKSTGDTWRIESLVRRANNEVGQYAKWYVSANLHTEVNASATNKTEI